jgi:hypothetical protein
VAGDRSYQSVSAALKAYEDEYDALAAVADRGGVVSFDRVEELGELREAIRIAHENQVRGKFGDVLMIGSAMPRLPTWQSVLTRLGPSEPASTDAHARSPVKRRHGRSPVGVPKALAQWLDDEIRERHERPGDRRWTQQAIADRVEREFPAFTGDARHLVQRAEALMEVRWPLPESDPDFRANRAAADFVFWPQPEKARDLLAKGTVRRAPPLRKLPT